MKKFGQSHVIVGSAVDCRTLTFSGKDQIRQEIDRTLAVGKDCPGLIISVGNHIPSNVPIENAMFYYEYLSEHWGR